MLTLLLGWTGVFHPEREGGGPPGAETTCRGLVPHYWNDEQRGEGEGGPAPAEWLSRGGTRKWVVQKQSRDGTRQWILAPLPSPPPHARPRPNTSAAFRLHHCTWKRNSSGWEVCARLEMTGCVCHSAVPKKINKKIKGLFKQTV